MRRSSRLFVLLAAVAALVGVAGAPAEARDPGPGGGCRLVSPRIDDGRITVIECYY